MCSFDILGKPTDLTTAGFFLPLSGGIDSCATSVIIHSMCRLVYQAIKDGNEQVIKDMLRITGHEADSDWRPNTPQDIAEKLFCTAYMVLILSFQATLNTSANSYVW